MINELNNDYVILENISKYFKVPASESLGQNLYSKKEFIKSHIQMIFEIIESDGGGSIVEIIRDRDFETQLKALSSFLLDISFNEKSKQIQLTYYV